MMLFSVTANPQNPIDFPAATKTLQSNTVCLVCEMKSMLKAFPTFTKLI